MYRLNNLKNLEKENLEYKQYHDFVFKNTIQRQANGVLKFLGIPYTIQNIIISEIASDGPKLHRLDFAGEAMKNNEIICLILECQSRPPTDDDIQRFFKYVTSLNDLKKKKVELYILCTEKTPYTIIEHVLKDDCIYKMKVISLKDFKAKDIFKNIENKIEHNQRLSEEDIASLQLIAYTDYEESTLELMKKAYKLIRKIDIDENEKEAMLYLFDVLSANMLNEEERNELMEDWRMMLNPRYEYIHNEGKQEGILEGKLEGKQEGILEGKQEGILEGKLEIAKNLTEEGMPLEKIIKLTGLTKEEILNAK